VLFCDIVGSTLLTERLGAEAMRGPSLARFWPPGLAEVDRYGGTAPQFTGDGFPWRCFGAPVTQERPCSGARLLAALAIQRAARAGARDTSGAEEIWICRCGSAIHTGPGWCSARSPIRLADGFIRPIGDTANVAARIQQRPPSRRRSC